MLNIINHQGNANQVHTVRYHFTTISKAKIRKTITGVCDDMEKLETS